MKNIIILLICSSTILSIGQTSSIIAKPKVDKRIEMLSIVFRLAGSNEYSSEVFQFYTDRILNHYDPFKNHKLIDFIKKIRKENKVGYDAVMSMAVHLDTELSPLVSFSETVPDVRWGKENAYEFVKLLKDFYQISNSEQFFKENQELYKKAEERFKPVYGELDLEWYKSFYGKEPNEEFIIKIGLSNGGGNYGLAVQFPNKQREVYAIMGTWKTDSTGMAVFPREDYFPTLLHEFNHSFVNYLLNENPRPFEDHGKEMFNMVKNKMNAGGYNSWQTMLNEALVRAAVIKYMKDHNFEDKVISLEISEQIDRGFVWIESLVAELENYDAHRNDYPTLESYMPRLAVAYAEYAENMDYFLDKNEDFKPRFVSIGEFENGSQIVDASLKQITINFDKPFRGSQFIRPGKHITAFPKIRGLNYSEDSKSAILDVILEKNKTYTFYLIGLAPKSEENSRKDYKVSFKTLN